MPALFTPLRQQRQQRKLERAFVHEASPIPAPRPRRPWLVLLLGAGIGVAVGASHHWLITPLAQEPKAEQRCRFKLPPAGSVSLEPVITPEQQARINSWLGPQLPKPAAPAPPPESQEESEC